MPRRKGTPNTPQKTIDEIVRKHHEGESIKSLARKYNKPFKTIKNMCTRENNKLRNHNIPKQRGRKPAKTLQEYKYEKQEIKDGKRTVAGFSLTHRKEVRTSVKYMVIFRHKEKYSISEMCRFFKVSRSGYYGYVSRMNIPAWDLPLAEKIKECQEKCGRTYGYRRVHIWLERNGIHRNPKTILRVVQKYGLLSVIRRKKYRNYGDYLHKYPNLLNRNFSAERPNQKWVTDISYIHTKQGVLYLSVIRDLYDNSIVAYKTGTEQNINLVLSTIRAAKKKERVTAELQLHSDQGFQYTSTAYFKLTQSYGITPSMSRRGNPYDNALAENFFSILKTECIYRTKLQTCKEASLLIG